MYAAFALGAPSGPPSTPARLRGDRVGDGADPARHPACSSPLDPSPAAWPAARSASVAGAVWLPGLGVALSSVGFGAGHAFVRLLFADRGWTPAGSPSAPSRRLHRGARRLRPLPDRLGGARSRWSACDRGGRAGLIWLAPSARWLGRGRRSPAWATRWSIPASAWSRPLARRRRAAGSPWEPTPPSSTWRLGWPAQHWGWSRAAPGFGRVPRQHAGRAVHLHSSDPTSPKAFGPIPRQIHGCGAGL